jgi:GNAT superfamily N-acetyltransferase
VIKVEKSTNAEIVSVLNEELQSLHTRLYPTMFKAYNQEQALLAFKEMLELENCFVFIAYEGEEPVGYLLLFVDHKRENAFMYEAKSLYIDQIMVKRAHQKKGIAKKLLDEVKLFAKSLDINRLHLDHWAYNMVGADFFKKAGFEYYNKRMELNF